MVDCPPNGNSEEKNHYTKGAKERHIEKTRVSGRSSARPIYEWHVSQSTENGQVKTKPKREFQIASDEVDQGTLC